MATQNHIVPTNFWKKRIKEFNREHVTHKIKMGDQFYVSIADELVMRLGWDVGDEIIETAFPDANVIVLERASNPPSLSDDADASEGHERRP